ncbi:MAG: glycosyltransferase family 39 protein [Chloroflexota bacterium]|nr:glycosyltransferase family 39 protein [Chloroflexota bacterium]
MRGVRYLRKLTLSQQKLGLLWLAMASGAFLRLYLIGSLPAGLTVDEAYHGLDALDIIAGARPVFQPTNFGREALFDYLVVPFIWLLGEGGLPIHLTSVTIGILTLPVIYLLGEELFAAAESSALRRWGALFAAEVAALSYWHLNWSRYGVRAILVPLCSALTFYFLWRAFRTNSRFDFVLAGIALGLGAYTYHPLRLLPLLVLAAFFYQWRSGQRAYRSDWRNLVVVTLTSLLVFFPLGYYFITHPETFLLRAKQVYVLDGAQSVSDVLNALGQSVWRTVAAFLTHGGMEPMHNILGRPLLNPFLATCFVLGGLISLWRWRNPQNALLCSWWAIMLVPAALSTSGAIGRRVIGAFVPTILLLTLGVFRSWDWVVAHGGRESKWRVRGFQILIGLGLLYTGGLTYYQYFIVWPAEANLFRPFETGIAGQYVATLSPAENVYVSPLSIADASFRYHSGQREDVRGYNGRTCFVFPRWTRTETTYLIVPGDDQQTLPLLTTYFPATQLAATGPEHHGQLFFQAYRVPAGVRADFAPSQPLEVTWGAKIHLLGYDLPVESYRPGESLQLTLYYEPLTALEEDYTVFVHLLSAERGEVWGQRDSEPCQRCYPTSVWQLGEVVRDQVELTISAEAVPGLANLQMGFYLWPEMEQLSLEPDVVAPLRLQQVQIESQ